MGVGIDTQRGCDVCVAKQGLNRLRVRALTNEEARKRVAQIVETKQDRFPFFEHSRRDCHWPAVILNQHVCDSRLLPLESKTGEYPTSRNPDFL
jgi:hypothetical protein